MSRTSEIKTFGVRWQPAGDTAFLFLVHPTLTDTEIAKTIEMLAEVLATAGK